MNIITVELRTSGLNFKYFMGWDEFGRPLFSALKEYALEIPSKKIPIHIHSLKKWLDKDYLIKTIEVG